MWMDDDNRDDLLVTIISPTDSETGLIDNNSNKEDFNLGQSYLGGRLTSLNQVVQNLRFPGSLSPSNHYTSLSSDSPDNLGLSNQVPSRPLLARSVPASGRSAVDILSTPHGRVRVDRAGNSTGPALITFHDLGLNGVSNFQAFFSLPPMASVMAKFRVYHITAPGQEAGAEDLPSNRPYPSMDQLSEIAEYVCHNYGIPHAVGMGVGLGANVLVRLASRRPKLIDGLVLVNCTSQTTGWIEWAYHKVNTKQLKKVRMVPDSVVEYLIWHHLGSLGSLGSPTSRGLDAVSLASIYRQNFSTQVNPCNLSFLEQTYATRTDLHLSREVPTNGKSMYGQSSRSLKMQVLNMVGDHSPHVEATVTLNGRLDPTKCTWMKIGDAGMVLEEQPQKVAEAVKLFLQGLGHTLQVTRSQSVTATPTRPTNLQLKGYQTPLVQLRVKNIHEDFNI